jgi:hypothetical protein
MLKTMLFAAPRSRFSKTARSHPGHREARRDDSYLALGAVVGGIDAHDVAERSAESPEAREADVEADVRDRALSFSKQEHGALDASALQVAVWSLVKRRPEGPDEMSF